MYLCVKSIVFFSFYDSVLDFGPVLTVWYFLFSLFGFSFYKISLEFCETSLRFHLYTSEEYKISLKLDKIS